MSGVIPLSAEYHFIDYCVTLSRRSTYPTSFYRQWRNSQLNIAADKTTGQRSKIHIVFGYMSHTIW